MASLDASKLQGLWAALLGGIDSGPSKLSTCPIAGFSPLGYNRNFEQAKSPFQSALRWLRLGPAQRWAETRYASWAEARCGAAEPLKRCEVPLQAIRGASGTEFARTRQSKVETSHVLKCLGRAMCLAMSGRIASIKLATPQSAAREASDSPGSGIDGGQRLDLWKIALVDYGGVRQWVSLACLPEAKLGDRVLVHVGMAIALEEE